MRPLDSSADADERQLRVYRGMKPSERLRVGLELTRMSRRLLEGGIRARHPEYSDTEVRAAVLRVWLGSEVFRRAYPELPLLDP